MPHSRQMCGMFWIPHHYANGPYFDGRSSFDLYCINSTHHRGYLAVDEVENDEGHGGVSGEQLPHTGLLGGKTSDAFRPHHTDRSMDAGHKGNRKHRRHCEQQVNLTNQATRTPRTAVQLLCYCWGKHTHTHTHTGLATKVEGMNAKQQASAVALTEAQKEGHLGSVAMNCCWVHKVFLLFFLQVAKDST